MENKSKNKKYNFTDDEDTTKYGEFIASYFGWMSTEKQKKRAKELEDITKDEN